MNESPSTGADPDTTDPWNNPHDSVFAELAVACGVVGRPQLERVRGSIAGRSLADVLVEEGSLSDSVRRAIESLLAERLSKGNSTSLPTGPYIPAIPRDSPP